MKIYSRILYLIMLAASLAAVPSSAKASPFDLFYEGSAGSILGSGGVQIQTYAALADVYGANFVSSIPTTFTIGPNTDLAGVAYDGQYHLFYQGYAGSIIGDGAVQIQTYATLNDVYGANFVSSMPTSFTVGPETDLAGIAYDGQYHLFYEGSAGSIIGEGTVQIQTYATLADIFTASFVSSVPTSFTVGPNIDLAGVAYDGQFRLFYEGSTGSIIGEGAVQIQTYATLDDIINSNLATSVPTTFTIGTNIDLAGVASAGALMAPVPLPAAVWLLMAALGSLGISGWQRKRVLA